MPPSHLLLILAINLIWGLNLVAAKVAFQQIPPLLFAALRFVLLFFVLLPWLRPVPGKMHLVLGAALTMGGAHFTLIYLGLARADDVSSVAIATQLIVPFSTILSIVILKERIRWRRALGIAFAFGGILVLGFDPRVMGYLDALAFVAIGALFAAFGSVLLKQIGQAGVFQIQAWFALVSWPILLVASGAVEEGQLQALIDADSWAWWLLVFSAFGASLIGHGGMYWLLQRHDLSLISPSTLLSVVFAVTFGVLLLDDQLTPRMLLGGALSLFGVLIIALRQPRRGPVPALD